MREHDTGCISIQTEFVFKTKTKTNKNVIVTIIRTVRPSPECVNTNSLTIKVNESIIFHKKNDHLSSYLKGGSKAMKKRGLTDYDVKRLCMNIYCMISKETCDIDEYTAITRKIDEIIGDA